MHHGAQIVEKFAELALILLLGTLVTVGNITTPGVLGWLLVAALIVVIRPAAVALGLAGTRLARGERVFVAWFGVRGIGSLYYAAVVLGLGVVSPAEGQVLFWTATAVIIESIVVHGVSAAPLGRRLLPAPGSSPEETAGGAADLPRAA